MAIYHLHAKTWSKGAGQGAGGHARYVLRQGPYAKRVVERVECSAVQRVEDDRAAEVVASYSDHLPAWVDGDPLAYWDAADAYERANGTVYRELEFALPMELSEERNLKLAQAFAEALARVDRGATPYTLVLHRSTRDPGLLHCHLMLSDRVNDGYERSPERVSPAHAGTTAARFCPGDQVSTAHTGTTRHRLRSAPYCKVFPRARGDDSISQHSVFMRFSTLTPPPPARAGNGNPSPENPPSPAGRIRIDARPADHPHGILRAAG